MKQLAVPAFTVFGETRNDYAVRAASAPNNRSRQRLGRRRHPDQGPEAQSGRRPAQAPGLRRCDRLRGDVHRASRALDAGRARAHGRPHGRDQGSGRSHVQAEPPEAARPARPELGDRELRGQHGPPRRIHPQEEAAAAGNQKTLGWLYAAIIVRRRFRSLARLRHGLS